MSRKQLNWGIAFVGLSILAGYAGSRILNSGKGAEMAFETLRQNHQEISYLSPTVLKVRSVSEVGGVESKYYTISFKDNHGTIRRTRIKCIKDKEEYKCIELPTQ